MTVRPRHLWREESSGVNHNRPVLSAVREVEYRPPINARSRYRGSQTVNDDDAKTVVEFIRSKGITRARLRSYPTDRAALEVHAVARDRLHRGALWEWRSFRTRSLDNSSRI